MKTSKKIRIFALVTALLMMLMCVNAFATDKLDQNMSGKDMSFAERFEYAMQGTATGMLMVFAVLTLLAIIVSIAGKILGPKTEKPKIEDASETQKSVQAPVSAPVQTSAPTPAASAEDDGELAAVITAAIAAMIESGDYKNEFVGGFRVVSFKRSSNGAWNRK